MEMKVRYHLAGGDTVRLVQVEALRPRLGHQGSRDALRGGEDGIPIHRREVEEVLGVGFGNDQGVPEGPRLDVEKGEHPVVFEEPVRRQRAGDDATENTVHGSTSSAQSAPGPPGCKARLACPAAGRLSSFSARRYPLKPLPRRLCAALLPCLGLGIAASAAAFAPARIETSVRFLEFDAPAGLLAYEVTLRNLSSLPVSAITLTAEPICLEGPLRVNDLDPEQQISRRFSFAMPSGSQLFQPRFSLEYRNFEGERIVVAPDRSPLLTSVDFVAVDLDAGRVRLRADFQNPSAESLLFLELWSENPSLDDGTAPLGDLGPGERLSQEFELSVPPGTLLFNPTLHVSFHAFHADGTRLHRNFMTLLQPRLDRVAEALGQSTVAP